VLQRFARKHTRAKPYFAISALNTSTTRRGEAEDRGQAARERYEDLAAVLNMIQGGKRRNGIYHNSKDLEKLAARRRISPARPEI